MFPIKPDKTNLILPILLTVHWAWKGVYAAGTVLFLGLAIGIWFSSQLLPATCMFGLFAILGLYMFVSAFTTIQVDEKSVMLTAPQGVYRIDWAEVTAIETNTINGRISAPDDEAFAFIGEDKCLPVNFKFAGKGKAEAARFIKRQANQLQIPLRPLSSRRLSLKNTLVSRFGFW